MNLNDLFLRIRAIVDPHRVERELDEELAFHIERETEKQIAAGLNPVDARTRARARFGSVPLAADQCRDARRTGFVDDLRRDIRYAFRTFRRAPFSALTIVATVALGLGLVTAVFTVYSLFVFGVDAVRNPGELFAVELAQRSGPHADNEDVPFTWRDFDTMRRQSSVFTDAFAMLDLGGPRRIEGRLARGALVTGNFFHVLGVQAALGRPLTPGDDGRFAGRPVIVLSHTGWHKLFRADRSVIGRRVALNDVLYEIVGVMPEGFLGLNFSPPDYWAPLALAAQFRGDDKEQEDKIAIEVIGRLKPGVSRATATAALAAWASGGNDSTTFPAGPISVYLRARQGALWPDVMEALLGFSPLFFAFGLILVIGCANTANLLLARGVSRQREIGIRLSVGASRQRIIRQLLTENLLLALAAAVCGLVLSRLFLMGALHAVITTLPPEIALFANALNVFDFVDRAVDWRVVVFVMAVGIMSTVFFGLAPALHASRLELVRTMHGEVTRDPRPGRARHALIAVQVSASALLLICAAIFLRGAVAAASRDPGVRTSDTVMVPIGNEPLRTAMLHTVAAHPLVAAVAASAERGVGIVETSVSAAAAPIKLHIDHRAVSSEFFDVLGINVVSGRTFTTAERTAEAGVAMVSETIARRLWPNGAGVGQIVRFEDRQWSQDPRPLPSRALTVVGVVRDTGRDSRISPSDFRADVYLPTAPENSDTRLLLRVRGNPEQARQALAEGLASIDPTPIFIMTLRTMTGMQTYMLQIGFWAAVVLGGLALLLTVSGLFSVLSYVVEQQAKEISVRIALGAGTNHVAALVLLQSLRPISIGLAAGGALAAALAIVLMATPAASEIPDTVRVFDPVAYIASFLVILTSCALAVSVPAWRAARIDPIATLRND
jgi:predicted permease